MIHRTPCVFLFLVLFASACGSKDDNPSSTPQDMSAVADMTMVQVDMSVATDMRPNRDMKMASLPDMFLVEDMSVAADIPSAEDMSMVADMPPEVPLAWSLPLLSKGPHLGLITGFEPLSEEVQKEVQNGAFVLSVGNEPEARLEEEPTAVPQLAAFIKAAREHVHTIEPKLAVTITLTQESLVAPFGALLIEETDVATFNYYPFFGFADFRIKGVSEEVIRKDVEAMLNAAKGRQLLIQELGCPAGPKPPATSFLETSEEIQASFIKNSAAVMAREPRLRAAVWFQHVDWSQGLVDGLYTNVFKMEGLPQLFIDRFAEWLMTSGFRRFEDGSQRSQGWEAFLNAQVTLKEAREKL